MSLLDKIMAIYETAQLEAISRSWCIALSTEKRHRMRTVRTLSVELAEIERSSVFATRTGESAIESVIVGEWRIAEDYVRWLRFEDQGEEVRTQYAKLWEKFTLALETACAEQRRLTASGNETPVRPS